MSSPAQSSEEEYYDVERVLDYRVLEGKKQFFIKWEGYGDEYNTWEPEEFLNCPDKLKEFFDRRTKEGGDSGGGDDDSDDSDEVGRLFMSRNGKGKEVMKQAPKESSKGTAKEKGPEKKRTRETSAERQDRMKRTASKVLAQKQPQKRTRIESPRAQSTSPKTRKGSRNQSPSPKSSDRRGSRNRSSSPKANEPRTSSAAAGSSTRNRRSSSNTSSTASSPAAPPVMTSDEQRKVSKPASANYKIPKRDPWAPLPPPLRPASTSGAGTSTNSTPTTSPTSPYPPGSIIPKHKRGPPAPATPNFDITKIVADIEKTKQPRPPEPTAATRLGSSSMTTPQVRSTDSRSNGAISHRPLSQNTARRTGLRLDYNLPGNQANQRKHSQSIPSPVVNDRVPVTSSLPIDSNPGWHGRLSRKTKHVADVDMFAILGRAPSKMDIFARLSDKQTLNIHSILPISQVSNILPALPEVDLFELHASANYLDLMKLANTLQLNDVAGIITIQPLSIFLVVPATPHVCHVLELRQAPHGKALLVHLPLTPFVSPNWPVPSTQPVYVEEDDMRKPLMIESELVASIMHLPFEIRNDSRGTQFSLYGPPDNVEVEEMKRMLQSFGAVCDDSFSSDLLRFVLIHRSVENQMTWIPNLNRLKRRRGVTFVLFGTSVEREASTNEPEIVFPSGGLLTASVESMLEDPELLTRLQIFADKQRRRGQHHSWRVAFRPDILRRLHDAGNAMDAVIALRAQDMHYALSTGLETQTIRTLDSLEVYKESESDLLTLSRLSSLEHLNRRFFVYVRASGERVKDEEHVQGVECMTMEELEKEFLGVGS